MADLTCPKCQSPMRSYERNGVTVDQCTGCRGVFLNRGELERLVDAEGEYYEQRAPQQQHREPEREHYGERQWGSHGYGHYGKRRKKEGFLGELFDFG